MAGLHRQARLDKLLRAWSRLLTIGFDGEQGGAGRGRGRGEVKRAGLMLWFGSRYILRYGLGIPSNSC
jgi:hypothetical protein